MEREYKSDNRRLFFNMPVIYPIGYFLRDVRNRNKYGRLAPKSAECIMVDANNCKISSDLVDLWYEPNLSGVVIEGGWPIKESISFDYNRKISACIMHWKNGIPWSETGIFEDVYEKVNELGSFDGCDNYEDIVQRYEELDQIFEEVKSNGRFKRRSEIVPKTFREQGGPVVHVGPNGKLFFSGKGNHRFAMSLILDIPFPAKIGAVHVSSLSIIDELRP